MAMRNTGEFLAESNGRRGISGSLFYRFNQAIQRYSGRSTNGWRKDALAYFRDERLGGQVIASPGDGLLTPARRNNVTDYRFPAFAPATTASWCCRKIHTGYSGFYILNKERETGCGILGYRLRMIISRTGTAKLVYTAYQSDPRWTNRNYGVIRLYDIIPGTTAGINDPVCILFSDINESGHRYWPCR